MTAPKRRWFRFSLRGLLLAVAIVAVIVTRVGLRWQRSAIHAALAHNYAVIAACAQNNQALPNFPFDSFPSAQNKMAQTQYTALYQYHQELSEKYQRATWRPWVILESDPPPPESN
jgi:hypothetical protein